MAAIVKTPSTGKIPQEANNNDGLLLSPEALLSGDDRTMFSPTLIGQVQEQFNLSLPNDPDGGLTVRPLKVGDYDRGYLPLLSQLTSVGSISKAQFVERFNVMANTRPQAYYVVVIEEKKTEQVVGSATLVLEWKFIHEAGARGRVEDVVVSDEMRGRQLGKVLNQHLVALATHFGVYKLSLECKDKLIGFYEQFGFVKDAGNNFMVKRFDKPEDQLAKL
uniref:Glucosamine 6-phosphate N-acetyltransferase n=1 Tax=Plectus sambesii TaxID=2011161 RepID=A0A914V8C9_9BILA